MPVLLLCPHWHPVSIACRNRHLTVAVYISCFANGCHSLAVIVYALVINICCLECNLGQDSLSCLVNGFRGSS